MTGTATVSTSERILSAGRDDGGTLIGYLPVGYPDLPTSIAAARGLVDGGAGIIELGLPYSDPVMDGPVIQHAVERALAGGTRVRDVLTAVEAVAATGAGVLVMTYWNPIQRYGVDQWARDLRSAGGAGLVTPDLIPDEAAEWIAASDETGLDRVFLSAPSSSESRLRVIAAASRGFVYASSTMGVTGERASVGARAEDLVARTRAAGAPYVSVGVGVSTPDQATEVARYADGVIVGSAFVRALTEAASPEAGVDAVTAASAALTDGVRRGRS